jgi:translocation and assembly module TamA
MRLARLVLLVCGLAVASSLVRGEDDPVERLTYVVSIEGFGAVAELGDLAEESSVLLQRIDDPPASQGAMRRRAREDEALLSRIAASLGYHDAIVVHRIDPPKEPGGPIRVLLWAEVGPLYTISDVAIRATAGGDAAAGVTLPRAELGLEIGAPARAEHVVAAEATVVRLLQERAFPLAALVERVAAIDRDAKTMSILYRVEPGPRARFGPVRVLGNDSVHRDYVVRRLPWSFGDPADIRKLEEGRRELVNTGVFSSAGVAFDDAVGPDGLIGVTVTVRERAPRSIGAGVSVSTSEGFETTASWTHRNAFGGAERLGVKAVLGEVETSLTTGIKLPDILVTSRDLSLQGSYTERRTDGFDSVALAARARVDRRVSETLGMHWGLSIERSRIDDDGEEDLFTLIGLPVGANRDTSDDLLNPTRGGRTLFQFTPYLETLGSTLGFYSTTLRHSQYFAVDRDGAVVFAVRAGIGSTVGASTDNVPADKRFYAGGSGSVRGYELQSVGPLDAADEPVGGSALLEFAAEVRWRVMEDIGVVPFIDAGQVYDKEFPDLDDELQWAMGLGLRYFTAIGPIRADLAFPINRRDSDETFQVYFSLGQAF